MTDPENPFAGQGAVLLDIGGDVGALVVTMPPELEGVEVEVRPAHAEAQPVADDHGHDHGEGHHHHPHVAVVNRPAGDGTVPSLVYPDLVAGDYVLVPKGGGPVHLHATITGGAVTTLDW
jgi:hypothetical protein